MCLISQTRDYPRETTTIWAQDSMHTHKNINRLHPWIIIDKESGRQYCLVCFRSNSGLMCLFFKNINRIVI